MREIIKKEKRKEEENRFIQVEKCTFWGLVKLKAKKFLSVTNMGKVYLKTFLFSENFNHSNFQLRPEPP